MSADWATGRASPSLETMLPSLTSGIVRAMSICRLLVLAALVAGAILLAFAPGALAAGPLQASAALSSHGQEGRSPAVALDGHGDAVAVWLNQYGFNWDIEASTRAGGGEWQKPLEISTPGDIGFHPEVAIDSRGDAVAVWRDGDTDQVETAIYKYGQEWQAPVAISAAGDNEKPTVALDSSGEAVVVWERQEGSRYVIQAAFGSAQSGVWGEPVDLSAPSQAAGNPQVAVDGQGEATVLWQSYGEGDYYIQAVTGSIGHCMWGEPVDLSVPGQVAANPQVAVNNAGEAVAVWEWGGIEFTPYTVQGAVRPAGGRWGASVDLSTASLGADFPDVAVDAQGNAVAVWEIREGSGGAVQRAVWKAASGAWQAPVALSPAGANAGSPRVAVDPNGDAIAVWSSWVIGGSEDFIQGAVSPAGQEWKPPVDISSTGLDRFSPQVAMDEDGNAVAVWESIGEDTGAIQSANYLAESEQPGGEKPISPTGEESERSGGEGLEVSARSDLASPRASGEPGGKEAKAPIVAKLRPASARSQCATVASKRTGKKALAASHRRRRGASGCAARVRAAHHGRRGH